jgi:hypothetical protein
MAASFHKTVFEAKPGMRSAATSAGAG